MTLLPVHPRYGTLNYALVEDCQTASLIIITFSLLRAFYLLRDSPAPSVSGGSHYMTFGALCRRGLAFPFSGFLSPNAALSVHRKLYMYSHDVAITLHAMLPFSQPLLFPL